jgi:serine/threonine-protein kinase RsbW
MVAEVQLVFRGSFDQLNLVWQTGECLLSAMPFPVDPAGVRHAVLVAVQELVTNILRHAYRGDVELPITIRYRVDETGCDIVIEDVGPPFDPTLAATPAAGQQDMPTEAGGYGILIARVVLDEIDYARIGDRNVLTLRKFVRDDLSLGVASKEQR